MLRDYLEISRFFNMGLTGVAPVLGAFSMYPGALSLWQYGILFFIGCMAHTYGFVLNDVFDVKIDMLSKDLTRRPLVSGSITRRQAMAFVFVCLFLSFVLTVFFYTSLSRQFALLIDLALAFALATMYDILSKRYPGMDIFVAGAVFFLILFGAAAVNKVTTLAWIVALIGGLQVLFMNMINGAIKDIDHDKDGKARTIAIWMGAKVHAGVIALPLSFKTTGYLIEVARTLLVFAPLVFFFQPLDHWPISMWVMLPALGLFTVLTFVSIYRLYSIKTFDRAKIRRGIGITVICMYATTPIMLSYLNPWFLIAALIPPVWFLFSNMFLHNTFLEPKTM